MQTPLMPFQTTWHLTSKEVDYLGFWRPRAAFMAMQQAAEDHALQLHAGYEALLQKGVVWVLARSAFSFERTPKLGEQITLSTWPAPGRHGCHPRYVVVRDQNGLLIGQGAFVWMLMRITTRTLVHPEEIDFDMPVDGQTEPPCPLPKRLKPCFDLCPQKSYTPAYSDLDLNGHVNNTVCLDWLCDALPLAFHDAFRLKEVQIDYNSELKGEVPLDICLHQEATEAGQALWLTAGDDTPKWLVKSLWVPR